MFLNGYYYLLLVGLFGIKFKAITSSKEPLIFSGFSFLAFFLDWGFLAFGMENKDKDLIFRNLQLFIEKAGEYRSQLINLAIYTEQYVGDIVALYFCATHEKTMEFRELFINTNKIFFGNKFELFAFVMKKTQVKFLEENDNFLKRIETIISDRNKLAHGVMNETEQLLKDFDGQTVTFYTYKTDDGGKLKTSPLLLNEVVFKEKLKNIEGVNKILNQLATKIRNANFPKP